MTHFIHDTLAALFNTRYFTAMSLTKREQAHIDRRLIQTLTEACETAKAEIAGFEWLTHTVDYARLSASLRVIWVFDSEASRLAALAAGHGQRMIDFTAMALAEAGLPLAAVDRHVFFDSEEAARYTR